MPNAAAKPPVLPPKTRSAPYRIVFSLVGTVLLSGFINLVPTGGIYPATLIIDGLYVLMLFVFLIFSAQNPVRVEGWMLLFVLLALVYVGLFMNGIESLSDKYLDLRNQVLYAFVGVFVATMIRNKDDLMRLLNVTMRLSVFLAAFGIIQFLFRSTLPEWLLVSRDTPLFGYFGTDISRSTGLIGNTIVFSNLLLLFFALFVAKLASSFRFKDLLATLVLAGGILVTFSRVAMIGAVAIMLIATIVEWFRRSPGQAFIRSFFILTIGAAATCLVYLLGFFGDGLTDSFVYRDLFMGNNASVQASTDIHNSYIDMALTALRENPWAGLGLASQNQNSINAESSSVITDGAMWSVLVEGGIILFAAYSLFLIACFIAAFKAWRATEEGEYVAAAFLMFSVYEFTAASIYNSAYFGKASFIMYWLIFGITIGLARTSTLPEKPGAPDLALQKTY